MHRGTSIALVILAIVILAVPVAAHSPEFPTGNESIEDATVVNDPTKSWAIYSNLHGGGEANYYRLPMRQGENITVQVIVPQPPSETGFLPSVALMGPGLGADDALPSYVEVPEGAEVRLVEGVEPDRAEYEPFSPSAFYELSRFSIAAPQDGDYYLAVFDDDAGGDYALAVGLRESFTIEEWLTVPFDAVGIYQWEGQSLPVIMAAPVLTFAAGLAMVVVARRGRLGPPDLLWALASVAGLLFIASGASMLFQMVWSLSRSGPVVAAVVTIMFAIIPIALGAWALLIAHRRRSPDGLSWTTRVALVAIGGLGLLMWGGYIIGPALVIIAAILPAAWLSRRLGGAKGAR